MARYRICPRSACSDSKNLLELFVYRHKGKEEITRKMKPTHQVLVGCGVVVFAVGYYYQLIGTVLSLLVQIVIAGLAVYLGVSWSLVQGKMYKPAAQPRESKMAQELIKQMVKNVPNIYPIPIFIVLC